MDILSKALQNIKDRRENAKVVANNCLLSLRADKEFATLEGEIAGLEWEKARREVYKIDYNDLDEKLNILSKKYDELLEKNGVKKQDLQPKYTCNVCNDTGYVNGKICSCVIKEVKRLQYKKYPYLVKMPKTMEEVDFDFYSKNNKYFSKIFIGLYERIIKNKDNLSIFTLQGNAGIGKSYIANYLARQAIEENNTVEIINAIKLNKLFLEYHLAPIEKKNSILSNIINCDLLVIDDLGVEQVFNNVTKPYLYQILIERLGNKTLITTNLSLRNLENKYDQRIFSRLMDKKNSLAIEIKGEDLRIK